MSILDNFTNNVERAASTFESGVENVAGYAADRSSQLWNSMKDGIRTVSNTASDLPEFLDFGGQSIFDSKINAQVSLSAGPIDLRAGIGQPIPDGTSNTVIIGERPDRDFPNRDGGRDYENGSSDCHREGRDGRNDSGRDRDSNEYGDRDGHYGDNDHRHHHHHGDRDHHHGDNHRDNGADNRYGDDSSYDLYENGWRYVEDGDSCSEQPLSPLDMLQQMQQISQQLSQLTALLAASGFGAAQNGGFPGAQGGLLPFVGAEGNASPTSPVEIIGEIAELAKKLAPLASTLAPALIALI
ncbi:MAG: hypothetical protein K2X77_02930 [Candidatus Obscuribacterales bacterium]|nr:hypothetical protein [Candidatus Obscuribacterales bacterium]